MSEIGPIFSRDPEIMGGALCIHGTRIPVSAIESFIDAGYSIEGIRNEYPTLSERQIRYVFLYAGVLPPDEAPRP